MTATAPTEPAGPAPRTAVPPRERGTTHLDDRVYAKIARAAAAEALPFRRGDTGSDPSASVRVRGDRIGVLLSVDLPYPADLGGECARVRAHVAERVAELTGAATVQVALGVEGLRPARSLGRRLR